MADKDVVDGTVASGFHRHQVVGLGGRVVQRRVGKVGRVGYGGRVVQRRVGKVGRVGYGMVW